MPRLNRNRVVHKSTGGMLPSIPAPVDPVGNAPPLTTNTVALPRPLAGAHRERSPRDSFNSLSPRERVKHAVKACEGERGPCNDSRQRPG